MFSWVRGKRDDKPSPDEAVQKTRQLANQMAEKRRAVDDAIDEAMGRLMVERKSEHTQ